MSRQAWIVWFAMLAPVAADAQSAPSSSVDPPRVEIRLAGLWSPTTTGGTVQSGYSPALVNGTGTGTATQTLNVDTSAAWGVDAVLRVFATRSLGLEAGAGRTWSVLSGSGNTGRTELSYVSLQPPDYQPKVFRITDDLALADTRGDRRVTTLIVGPVWRVAGPASVWSLNVSGGLSLQRYAGAVRSLLYTEYRLGGHSTLFSSRHRVEVEPAATWFAGPYAAAEVCGRISGRLGLVAGARLHAGNSLLPESVRASRLVNPDEDVFSPEMDTVRAALEPGTRHSIVALRWQAFVGLSLSLH